MNLCDQENSFSIEMPYQGGSVVGIITPISDTCVAVCLDESYGVTMSIMIVALYEIFHENGEFTPKAWVRVQEALIELYQRSKHPPKDPLLGDYHARWPN